MIARSRVGCVLATVMLCMIEIVSGQQRDEFTEGNQEYAAGHFREATDLYTKLVSSGEVSAALFYNLGNAWYRAGDLGQSILNYERALALEPQQPEAEANLRLARDKARALQLKRNAVDRVAARATPTEYSIVMASSFWIAAFALAALFVSRRRAGAALSILVLSCITLAAAAYGLYAIENGPGGRSLAIVTAKTTEARLATADNAGTVLALPPGSEINILSTRGDWIYAALPNDLRGWIPAKNAELVRL